MNNNKLKWKCAEKSSLIRLKGLVGPLGKTLKSSRRRCSVSLGTRQPSSLHGARKVHFFFSLPLQVKVSASSEIHFVSPHVRQKIRYGKEEKNETNKVFEILWKFMCSFFFVLPSTYFCCLRLRQLAHFHFAAAWAETIYIFFSSLTWRADGNQVWEW